MPDPPVLLLPLRLETQLAPRGVDFDLLIRVFLDEVWTKTHERDLTDEEAARGGEFWGQAPAGGAALQAAWARLVDQFGHQRAAWIAGVLDPTSPPSPAVGRRSAAWTRAPHSPVLPHHWTVYGYSAAQALLFRQDGGPLPASLNTGPDPTWRGLTAGGGSATPAVDGGMRWMIDFATALGVGMALRVPITATQRSQLDRLLVVGWTAADATGRLEDLLDSHHYSGGLSCVPQGTPTNNTEQAPAGGDALGGGPAASLDVERGSDLLARVANPDGAHVARALGVAPRLFAHVRHADGQEQQDARTMNAALWSATWGYFLGKMVAGLFSYDATNLQRIEAVRRHFVDYVRGRGPLPALRIGRQPYGLLPAIALSQWVGLEGSAVDPIVVNLLRRLRPVWASSVPQVPRVTGSSARADQDLVGILGLEATSTNYAGRSVIGPGYFDYLFRFFQITMTDWWDRQRTLAQPTRDLLQLTANPMLQRSVFARKQFIWNGPLTQPDPLADLRQPLAADRNYLTWLRSGASGYEAIGSRLHFAPTGSLPGDGQPTPLLYRLLRHAALHEYDTAGLRIAAGTAADRIEPELVNVSPVAGAATPTIWDRLVRPVPSDPAARSIGHRLDDLRRTPDGSQPAFDEFWANLGHLAGRPAAALELALAESLDLCSHRLDAWITSFATKRLATLRNPASPYYRTGIYLGGYGWVENLAAATARGPNAGFVQAPSLDQAAAAAVLRSGWLSQRASGTGDGFAVDLSSSRLRLAKWLLDGSREQPLGALLGYRFERGLHEAQLDQYVDPFRRLAPLAAVAQAQVAAQDGTSAVGAAAARRYQELLASVGEEFHVPAELAPAELISAVESIAATSVVDGLALDRLMKAGQIPWGLPVNGRGEPLPAVGTPLYGALAAQLQALGDAVDAVGDAILAESVYQSVRGNPLRAGAAVEAVARGELPPPDLESARTPRSGIASTHRLMVLFDGDAPAPAAWAATPEQAARQVRAAAEPRLNAWVAQLLGDPARVRCRAEYLDPRSGAVLTPPGPLQPRLADLGLSPLDVVYLAEGADGEVGSELEQRLLYYLLRRADAPPEADVRLTFGRDPAWGSEVVSFPELLEVARGVRTLLGSARALGAADLGLPQAPADPVIDPEDLRRRVEATRTALTTAANRLAASDLELVRDGLLRAAYCGVYGAVPLAPRGDTPAEVGLLAPQVAAVAGEVARRVAKVTALEQGFDRARATPADQTQHDGQRLAALLGEEFRVLPRFQPGNLAALRTAFAASDALQGGDPLAAVTWVERLARVRDGVDQLAATLSYAEALGSGDGLIFAVAQLPYEDGDRWVALPLPPGPPSGAIRGRIARAAYELFERRGRQHGYDFDDWLTAEQQVLRGGSRVSLVAHLPAGFGGQPLPSGAVGLAPVAGLVVDEVVEVVPSATELTGLAFHYDEPNASAPQALLLAVPPADVAWSADLLAATVLETIELARVRMVDPEALRQSGQLLPALYFAVNLAQDTVSTDFTGYDLTRPPPPPPSIAAFVTQWAPLQMAYGEQYPAMVTMRNIGRSTWTTGGANPFRLGSQNPQDNWTWGLSRVELPATIRPGEQATFWMTVRAPTAGGTYNFQWRMLQEGITWFGAFTPNLQITVGPPVPGATFMSQLVPATMVAGQSYQVSVTMYNTGSGSWTTGGANPYRLGSQNPQDNMIWGLGRVELPARISPYVQTTFTFTVRAPALPGTYNFQWCMLQEGVTWFGPLTPNVAVAVSAPPPNPAGNLAAFVSQTVPTSMYVGEQVLVTVRMRNTGQTTWIPAGPYPFGLGSQNPQNNFTWGLNWVDAPGVVAPGAEAQFSFSVTAPSTLGTYNFQWRMQQWGVNWFGDFTPNVAVQITSKPKEKEKDAKDLRDGSKEEEVEPVLGGPGATEGLVAPEREEAELEQGSGQAFIRPDERPAVGDNDLEPPAEEKA